MPSFPLSENLSPEKKEKKMKKLKESVNLDSSIEKKVKKEKKKRALSDSDDFTAIDSEKKSKKKEKKRKLSEDEDERSETSSERGEPVNLKEKKSKKAKLMEEAEEEEENPNAVSNFRISEPLRNKLKSKGIEALFPIQAMTFNIILEGSDLVGRARTGQVIIGLFCDELLAVAELARDEGGL